MIRPDEIVALIQKQIPNAQVEVRDATGSGDHFYISVVSTTFEGKLLIDQHRLIQNCLEEALVDGRIHAVQIKTQTPSQKLKQPFQGNDLHVIE